MRQRDLTKPGVWLAFSMLMAIAGCGQSTARPAAHNTPSAASAAPQSPSSDYSGPRQTYIFHGNQYAGPQNLQHYLDLAKAHPNDATALEDAARAEFVNQNPQAALSYYLQAIKVDPNNGELYNNVGNLYYRSFNQPQKALPYYQKAVQLSPHYDYGWYNLVLLEQDLGNKAQAKQIAAQALTQIPSSDKLYPLLKKFASS
ncbi:MAG: tetratricopeptide repeat protein [Firmicutes bacterium]|nr:tetratricopeptide repeat protein [Bacillota bacterium]